MPRNHWPALWLAGAAQKVQRISQHISWHGSRGWTHLSRRVSGRMLYVLMAITIVASLGVAFIAFQPRARAANAINQSALLHDTRDPLFRSPGGAIPTGQAAMLRLRTAMSNARDVTLRVWNTADNGGSGGQELYPAAKVYSDGTYDYWQVTVPAQSGPRTLWYKWRVTGSDGTQVWYEDHFDTFLKSCDQVGGVGQVFSTGQDPDCSYRLNVYAAGFTAPEWVQHAVIYQIFVDRFYNGYAGNDATVQPLRYDPAGCKDPNGTATATGYYLHTNWNDEPVTPPQGCDFFGGDLQGVIAKLGYLNSLGVNTLYLNPIFMADSNHKYDTTDYAMIDPHFGNLQVWQQLVQKADAMGMHILLDGVFNHTSSDSVYFDRYHTWNTSGADATQTSRYENWYQFTNWPAYSGWFGFDSLPQLTEQQDVRNFLFAGDSNFVQDANDAAIRQQYGEQPLVASAQDNAIAKYWLAQGASGWRLDVPENKSDAWWQAFRTAIKSFDPQAISIGEHWGDASQWLLGNQQDGTMNYRFRDAVINFFDNGGIDPDPGHDNHEAYTASQFDAHLQTVLEEYPLPAVYASMNLVDSHDTGRILWELGDTPGASADQVALAKQKLRLIALFQMTWIGAPTIYSGDEAGQTQTTYGSSKVDPGNRRTFPWDHQDTALEDWYRQLIHLRTGQQVLQTGAEKTLLSDDANRVFAFQRRDDRNLAVVILNADAPTNGHTTTLALQNVPDGTQFSDALTNQTFTVSGSQLSVPVAGESGRVLLASPGQVRQSDAPQGVQAFHLNGANVIQWNAVSSHSLAGYNVYRSFISGGFYQKVNTTPVTGTSFTDQGTDNAKHYFYVVRAVGQNGVESSDSAAVTPILRITFAGDLAPATLNATLNVAPGAITAVVTAPGSTDQATQGPWITAQIGNGPVGSDPTTWTWTAMAWQGKTGDSLSDIYLSTGATPEALGKSSYLARFSGDDGTTWTYAYVDHGTTPGTFVVSPATDTTPPAAPAGLAAATTSQQVTLSWNVVPNPSAGADIWRYVISRSTNVGGPFSQVATLLAASAGASPSYTDTGLTNKTTYYYQVAAESNALVTGPPAAISAVPHVPVVHVTFDVTVPPAPGTPVGDKVYIAGGAINNWDPGATPLAQVDPTHWSIQLDLPLGANLQYKYTRGSWDTVQKDPLGNEINNLTYLLPTQDGAQVTIYDSVAGWRKTSIPAGYVAVQWNVQAPPNTPPGAQLYLAGNQWPSPSSPWAPNGAPLRSMGGGFWQYTQVVPVGTDIQYKYTRGSWATVEVASNGSDISNRDVVASVQQTNSVSDGGVTSTYAAHVQTDSVADWHDHPSAPPVAVTFTVAIPAGLPASDTVYIAGDQINGWNPGATPMTRTDATHWTYTQTLPQGSQVQYKYTLGSWASVENICCNRSLTVTDQGSLKMTVNDTVSSWTAIP